MMNPMQSLPAYGAVLKNRCKLNTTDADRSIGDLCAAVLDYLIGLAWVKLGLFEEEEKQHRMGVSISEIQEFLDWAFARLAADMEWNSDEVADEMVQAYEAFIGRCDDD